MIGMSETHSSRDIESAEPKKTETQGNQSRERNAQNFQHSTDPTND
jgi:hypothetical protein